MVRSMFLSSFLRGSDPVAAKLHTGTNIVTFVYRLDKSEQKVKTDSQPAQLAKMGVSALVPLMGMAALLFIVSGMALVLRTRKK